jgi:hypothetical protein
MQCALRVSCALQGINRGMGARMTHDCQGPCAVLQVRGCGHPSAKDEASALHSNEINSGDFEEYLSSKLMK